MPNINEKDAIRNLQRYLRQLSYTDENIASPPIDGIFDTVTEDSLKAFQRRSSLPESGVADRETWNRLYEEYLRSLEENALPEQLSLFPRTPTGYYLSLGDEYYLVSIIQLLLNELRIIYDSFIPLVVSGIFDEATEANIIDFQKKNQLPTTGRVDRATWNRIARSFDDYANDYVR